MKRRTILTSLAASTALAATKSVKPTAAIVGGSPSFIETDDRTKLFVRDWAGGAPVLFVHSWAVNADLWQYQMVHLCENNLRCIAFDRRGHGRSSEPGHGYTADRLADDLAAVINQVDLKNLTLVGHSLGCGEIVRYLSRHGARRVARVVLVAPTLPYTSKTPDNPDGVVTPDLAGRLRARMASDFPGWVTENARGFFVPETSQAMLDWGIRMITQTPLKVVLDCNRVVNETDYRAELSKIDLPVLIIHGDKDLSAPLDLTGRKTAQLIPRSRLIVYEGGPHGLMFRHRERLNSDLLAFAKS
jgi:pimeloyl-ACP methyl ester carboxylesterase